VRWDGTDDLNRHVEGGVYFFRLNVAQETKTRRVLFLK
jgi:hypothetical protein